MKICGCFALLALAGLSGAQLSLKDDFVVSGDKAYGMMPPEPVCGGMVSQVTWSSDGRYLLSVRRDPGSSTKMQHVLDRQGNPQELQERSIVLYSLADRKASVVWSSRSPLVSIHQVQWMTGTDVAYALISEQVSSPDPSQFPTQRTVLVQIDGHSASSRTLVATQDLADLALSPLKPIGLLIISHRDASARGPEWSDFRILSANGSMSEAVRSSHAIMVDGWTANGESPIVDQLSRESNGRVVRFVRQLDLRTGEFLGTPKKGDFYVDPSFSNHDGWSPEAEKAYETSHPLLLDARRTTVTFAS